MMKATNRDIVDIYQTLNEIVGCKEAKVLLPESGKIMFALIKNRNKMKKTFESIRDREWELRDAANLSTTKENENAINIQLKKDLESLLDNEEQEIEVHQMNLEAFEILQKYLSGPATITLLTYLIKEIND